jgi:hypothetical protein
MCPRRAQRSHSARLAPARTRALPRCPRSAGRGTQSRPRPPTRRSARGTAEAGRRGARAGGVFVTDVTNASRTGLMDLESLSWHEPTLAYFGVPAGALPAIRSNAEVYGRVADGPLAGVPIAGARAAGFQARALRLTRRGRTCDGLLLAYIVPFAPPHTCYLRTR